MGIYFFVYWVSECYKFWGKYCVPSAIGLWDFLSSMFLKPWKGSGTIKGLLRREGVRFLGWNILWEMRGCEMGMFARVGTPVSVIFLCLLNLSFGLGSMCPGGVSILSLGVANCWEFMNNKVYDWEERLKSVASRWITKDKCLLYCVNIYVFLLCIYVSVVIA